MTETAGRIARDDGEAIAWRRLEGHGPTIVWCDGTRSDMTATKATTLAAWAVSNGNAMLRFDYFGHGASSGAFAHGTIGRWRADALAAVDALTTDPLVLVGSSMGGWIAILVAMARPDRTAGLVLVAPAVDYPQRLIEPAMTDANHAALARNGAFTDAHGESYTRTPSSKTPTAGRCSPARSRCTHLCASCRAARTRSCPGATRWR